MKLLMLGVWDVAAAIVEQHNISAPCDGYFCNVEINIAIGANTGRLFMYVGKLLPANIMVDIPNVDNEYSWFGDLEKRGMYWSEDIDSLSKNETARFLVLHSGKKKFYTQKGEIFQVQLFADAAQTNLRYYLTGDFVPYKNAKIAYRVRRSSVAVSENLQKPLQVIDSIEGSHLRVDWYIEDPAGTSAGYLLFYHIRSGDILSYSSNATTFKGEILDSQNFGHQVAQQTSGAMYLGKIPFSNQGKSIQRDVIPVPRDFKRGDIVVFDVEIVTTEVTPTIFTVDLELHGSIMYGPAMGKKATKGVWTDGIGYIRMNNRVQR